MDKLVAKLLIKYSWLMPEEALGLAENAIGWFYVLRYPCEPNASLETHPIESYMDRWCVERICEEISQRNGFNTALGYRENGVSFTFDSAWISESLRRSIIPYAGVV